MRTSAVLLASASLAATLAACADAPPPPPAAPPPVVAQAPVPVVVGYRSDLRSVAAKRQVLHSAKPGECLDVKGDNAAQHALVRLSGCHGRENQRWDFGPGAGGAVQVGGIGGLCLTLMSAPAPDGTMLELLTCNGSPAQEFRFYVDGRIQDLAGGRCLTPGGGSNGNGILLAPCDGTNPTQVWSLDAQ